jgi:hypothetical protein
MGEVRFRTPCNFVEHCEFFKTRSSEKHILNKGVINMFSIFYIFPMWNELARSMSTEVHLEFCEQRRSESNLYLWLSINF